MKYELLDHGQDHSQYFQGCGTAYTDYDNATTGIGDTPAEALEDCIEQIAADTGGDFATALEKQILSDFPAFADPKKNAAAAVDRGEKEQARIEELISDLEEESDDEDDEDRRAELLAEIASLEKQAKDIEDAREVSELWYHISIRWSYPENLDGLCEDDLLDFAEDEDNDIVLRAYAKLKTEAMTHRAAGRIETALQTETTLEHIYNNLSGEMKW